VILGVKSPWRGPRKASTVRFPTFVPGRAVQSLATVILYGYKLDLKTIPAGGTVVVMVETPEGAVKPVTTTGGMGVPPAAGPDGGLAVPPIAPSAGAVLLAAPVLAAAVAASEAEAAASSSGRGAKKYTPKINMMIARKKNTAIPATIAVVFTLDFRRGRYGAISNPQIFVMNGRTLVL
jgi:hypothetical protein